MQRHCCIAYIVIPAVVAAPVETAATLVLAFSNQPPAGATRRLELQYLE